MFHERIAGLGAAERVDAGSQQHERGQNHFFLPTASLQLRPPSLHPFFLSPLRLSRSPSPPSECRHPESRPSSPTPLLGSRGLTGAHGRAHQRDSLKCAFASPGGSQNDSRRNATNARAHPACEKRGFALLAAGLRERPGGQQRGRARVVKGMAASAHDPTLIPVAGNGPGRPAELRRGVGSPARSGARTRA